jgi:hypothetical protein
MKLRLSVYVDPDLMVQLTECAKRRRQSKSQVANAALESFLTLDDADRREAAVTGHLDQLTRHVDQLQGDLHICVEALALFIRTWLSVTPLLPANPQTAAQAKGLERYGTFIRTLGRWLANGHSLADEIALDASDEAITRQHETAINSDRDASPAR